MIMRYLQLFSVAVAGCFLAAAGCEDDEGPGVRTSDTLTIDFEGRVGSEPLALGEVTYAATGAAEGFRPTRVSFFLSGVELLDDGGVATPVAEVAYVELDPAGSARLSLADVPTGTYSGLRFRVGLTEAQDASVPADYASSHPLGRASEYWIDWGSYIFLKLEGRSDTLADGRERFDAAYTYHVGRSAELARAVEFDLPIDHDGDGGQVDLTIDLGALLGLGSADELSVVGVADHRNGAAARIMDNVDAAFSPRR